MDLTLAELLNLIPDLAVVLLVIYIYRDGAVQLDKREERLRRHHKEELDRLRLAHTARVEDCHTTIDKILEQK